MSSARRRSAQKGRRQKKRRRGADGSPRGQARDTLPGSVEAWADSGRPPSSVGGVVSMACIVLVVWVWMSLPQQRSESVNDRARTSGLTASFGEPSGFRAEAWFLPDEELLGFVEVPGGPFLMGSDPAIDPLAFDNEWWPGPRPQATVDLPSFYAGRYEVTVAQFGAFVEETGYRAHPAAFQVPPEHPVAAVAWTDALAYARWLETTLREWPETPPELSRLLGDGWRITLPTEAEWEKAARGSDGRIYPWGSEPRRDRANYGGRSTAPVGSFECPECPFGLLDMSGNVWEWTRSPYQDYPYDDSNDHEGLDADALWVMRGGAFNDTERNVRTAIRGGAEPGVRRPFIGFRLVITGP